MLHGTQKLFPKRGTAFRTRKLLSFLGAISETDGRPQLDEYGRKYRTGGYKMVRRGPHRYAGEDVSKVFRSRLDHTHSAWWTTLADQRTYDEHSYTGKQFRKDFRVPRCIFDELLKECQQSPVLADKEEGPGHGRGQHRVPTSMKLLACLYMLGKGCDFRTARLIAHVHETTIERFYHNWTAFCADGPVYTRWVHMWADEAALQADMAVYSQLGLPGGCGSMDASHLPWARCPSKQTALHKRPMDGYPTLAVNMIVNNRRRIMHTTGVHPGTRNDKTLVKYTLPVVAMRRGSLMVGTRNFSSFQYNLRTRSGDVTCSSPYLLTDGGYHKWRMLQCPAKFSSHRALLRWSKRVESVRKDVECTFGILKQRFRMLRVPMEFKKAVTIEDTFKTCCMLHNRLLHHDGLDTIGDAEADWLAAELTAEAQAAECAKLDELVQRYKTVPSSVDAPELEVDTEWGELRMQLVEHYSIGLHQWCRRAADCRPRPHITPGFTVEDSDDADEHMHGNEDEFE